VKPARTYLSVAALNEKTRFFLLIFLLVQFFFIGLTSFRIPIPNFIIQKTFSFIEQFPEGVSIDLNNCYLKGFSKIECESLQISLSKELSVIVNNLELFANPFVLKEEVLFFSEITISNAQINSLYLNEPLFEVRDLKLTNHHLNWLLLSSSLKLARHEIKVLANLELDTLLQKEDTAERINLINLIHKAGDFIHDFKKAIHAVPTTNLDAFVHYEDSTLTTNLKQIDNFKLNPLKGLRMASKFDFETMDSCRFIIDSNSISFGSENNYAEIISPKIWLDINFSKGASFMSPILANLSFSEIRLSGKIDGNLPAADIFFSQNLNDKQIDIFSNSKDTHQVSLRIKMDSNGWKNYGFLSLRPSQFNLKAKLPQGTLKIMDGESLEIRFHNYTNSNQSEYITQFFVEANYFSPLESPNGYFRFSGEIKQNFNIFISNAFANFGRSKATGTYLQKWNPAKFRFLIKGECFPPDIENWLGTWWEPIWKDFSFSDSTPQGDFSISGEWGGSPGSSLTFGSAKVNKFHYRDFFINSTDVIVEVDSQSIQVNAPKISHSLGAMGGSLIFPHKRNDNPVTLEFNIEGDFPFNDAKGIFGEKIKNTLSHFDAPLLSCNGSGKIYSTHVNFENDTNQTTFDLELTSLLPVSYKGITIPYITGTLEKNSGKLKGHFPRFSLAGGKGRITFEEKSSESELIHIIMNLEGSNRIKLIEIFEESDLLSKEPQQPEYSNNKLNSETQELGGLVDLSFNAEGPVTDPLQFVGTGNFTLSEVEIGSINLLGGIRSKLGAFNLPLPSDALNFNRLEAPFYIDQQFIRFDQIRLTGPLSLIDANGEMDLAKKDVNLFAKLKLAGNLKIPLIKQIVNFADPLSKLSSIKISGPWSDPYWQIHIAPN